MYSGMVKYDNLTMGVVCFLDVQNIDSFYFHRLCECWTRLKDFKMINLHGQLNFAKIHFYIKILVANLKVFFHLFFSFCVHLIIDNLGDYQKVVLKVTFGQRQR